MFGEASGPAVEVLTTCAGLDALHPEDYREIYDELRQFDLERNRYAVSIDKFCVLVGSRYSKALWSKWDHGLCELNREQRNELRRVVGLPALPPSVAETLRVVDENAEVVRVGDEEVLRVVLVGTQEPLTLHVNGAVEACFGGCVGDEAAAADCVRVTPVTRAQRRHVSLSAETFERVNAVRVARGLSWEALLGLALERLGDAAAPGR